MSDFREVMFWPIAFLFLAAVAMTLIGLATLSKGGLRSVYIGLVFVVGLGFILLDGVVSNKVRLLITVPALAFLVVWHVQQRRGQWPPERPAKAVR